jgi:hypothetical protein
MSLFEIGSMTSFSARLVTVKDDQRPAERHRDTAVTSTIAVPNGSHPSLSWLGVVINQPGAPPGRPRPGAPARALGQAICGPVTALGITPAGHSKRGV